MSTLRTTIVAGATLVFSLATANAQANLTHTTSNLNLRGGPGTQYPIRAVIPAGAEIDVHSCGHQMVLHVLGGSPGIRESRLSHSSRSHPSQCDHARHARALPYDLLGLKSCAAATHGRAGVPSKFRHW